MRLPTDSLTRNDSIVSPTRRAEFERRYSEARSEIDRQDAEAGAGIPRRLIEAHRREARA